VLTDERTMWVCKFRVVFIAYKPDVNEDISVVTMCGVDIATE
jgi:hypothetical protein